MQSDDAAEPIDWDVEELKRSIDEWEGIAAQIIVLMHETVDAPRSCNWRPHFQQILAVVCRFRELCRDEARQLGAWRADGLAPDEAYERVWDAGDQLVKWLHRMMQQ
jgi:hypothetical protein